MAVKLTDKVRYNGEITTIQDLDSQGLIEYEKCDNMYSNRTASGVCTKYFANIKEDESGWEINKTAYLSRTGQKDKIGKVEKFITVEGLEITQNAIKSFNMGIFPSFNDNWNIAQHQGTIKENRYLREVAHYYGVDKLNSEDVRRFIEREKIKTL
jgi:hypothetical protein